MNIETFREFCLSLPFVTEDTPFDDTTLVFRLKHKIFACISMDKPNLAVMKCDPQRAIELREQYSCVEGAWHWNKKYWNQIELDRFFDEELLQNLVRHAWNEVNKKLPKKDREKELGFIW